MSPYRNYKSRVCVKNNIFVGFIVNDKNNFSSYVYSYYESTYR